MLENLDQNRKFGPLSKMKTLYFLRVSHHYMVFLFMYFTLNFTIYRYVKYSLTFQMLAYHMWEYPPKCVQTLVDISITNDDRTVLWVLKYTVFHWINAPGAWAGNEPLSLVWFWWNLLCGLLNTLTLNGYKADYKKNGFCPCQECNALFSQRLQMWEMRHIYPRMQLGCWHLDTKYELAWFPLGKVMAI